MTPAFASLIGDTMHVKVIDEVNNFVACDLDVVVGPGVEIPDCSNSVIDIDGDSIWFEFTAPQLDGALVSPVTYEFTEMHWTNNPNGFITGVTEISPTTIPIGTPVFDDHSITITNNAFTLDCGGQSECLIEWHVDIETDHPVSVGGELIPLDSTMILAAGTQYTAAWMIPAIVSAIGIAIVIARKF